MFKKRSVLAIIVTVIVAGSTTFGTLMYLDRRLYMNYLQGQYQRNLYSLISDIDGLQVSLSKVAVTSSTKQSLILFGEIWRQASEAEDKLNALPVSHVAISQTSKFLSQVGDFCFTLLKASSSGQKLSDAEWNNVDKLKDYSGYLSVQLHALEREIDDNKINWGEIKHKGYDMFVSNTQNEIDLKFESISKELQQYPTLIYDGPFSENVLNIKPKVLSEASVTYDAAKKIAAGILENRKIENIKIYSSKSGETIPVYALSMGLKGEKGRDVNIDISKNGGKVVYMLNPRDVGSAKLSMDEAIKKGSTYLKNTGYVNMIPTYSLRYDNIAVINYVYTEDKVVIYPDQIKLKIALDNGEVVGIEAQHYLTAHYNRTIPQPKITVKEALNNVSRRLQVKSSRLTIIPMESKREVLCYEFYGTYKGEKYIIYIDAIDGREEKILKILETSNGELTM